MKSHKQWIEQCDAAEVIRERFGVRSALGYLVGEKFLGFLREADASRSAEVEEFVGRIREVFDAVEIDGYLSELQQPGAVDDVDRDSWDFASFREAGLKPEDVVEEAEDIVVIERARELLLD